MLFAELRVLFGVLGDEQGVETVAWCRKNHLEFVCSDRQSMKCGHGCLIQFVLSFVVSPTWAILFDAAVKRQFVCHLCAFYCFTHHLIVCQTE
jgi:hypothetical protein